MEPKAPFLDRAAAARRRLWACWIAGEFAGGGGGLQRITIEIGCYRRLTISGQFELISPADRHQPDEALDWGLYRSIEKLEDPKSSV